MYLLIRYPVGIIVQGVVLAKGRNRLRVAVSGFQDAIELKRSGPQWFTEAGEPIEFDFMMPSLEGEEKTSSPGQPRVTRVAGATTI